MGGTDLCACGHKRQSHRLAERECFYSSCLCTKFDFVNAEFPLPDHFRDFDEKVAYNEDEGKWVRTGKRGSVMDCRVCRGNIDRCDCGFPDVWDAAEETVPDMPPEQNTDEQGKSNG